MIVIADAGPILHLHWVDALSWALPPQRIEVVAEVWAEVEGHAPEALADGRFHRVRVRGASSIGLSQWDLDAGEQAAIHLALRRKTGEDVLMLCDELEARHACRALHIPVIGSIGLIVEACRAGRVDMDRAAAALPNSPKKAAFTPAGISSLLPPPPSKPVPIDVNITRPLSRSPAVTVMNALSEAFSGFGSAAARRTPPGPQGPASGTRRARGSGRSCRKRA